MNYLEAGHTLRSWVGSHDHKRIADDMARFA